LINLLLLLQPPPPMLPGRLVSVHPSAGWTLPILSVHNNVEGLAVLHYRTCLGMGGTVVKKGKMKMPLHSHHATSCQLRLRAL
jgi:hypothetical protein